MSKRQVEFGDKSSFAISVGLDHPSDGGGVTFEYWLRGCRIGGDFEIEPYDALESFELVRGRVPGIEDCDIFTSPAIDLALEYKVLLNNPNHEELDQGFNRMMGLSMWFHHVLGEACIHMVSCEGFVRISALLEGRHTVIEAVENLDRFVELVEACGRTLGDHWQCVRLEQTRAQS